MASALMECVEAALELALVQLVAPEPAVQLAACERIAALGADGIAPEHAESFARAGGVARLTSLLRATDAELVDAAAEALARVTSLCSGHVARPRELRFDGGDGGARARVLVRASDAADAGTGHDVWTSALLLCKWLCTPRGVALTALPSRDVLELGAGCGACGFVAAALGARSVALTDNQPSLLAALVAARALNGLVEPRGRVRVAPLDWGIDVGDGAIAPELDPTVAPPAPAAAAAAGGAAAADGATGGDVLGADERFGLVLGADIIYEAAHPSLVARVAGRRLAPGGLVLIVVAVRKAAPLANLLAALAREPTLCEVEDEALQSEAGELALPELVESATRRHASHYVGGIRLVRARGRPQSHSQLVGFQGGAASQSAT
jgi:predicted nicotinamide N-methyase